jgi:hypothetical protein
MWQLAMILALAAQPADESRKAIRRPFLRGAFVTYNTEMPIEIDQAIAGRKTDRPVIVWAGK